ncbi:uncharacterized protein B0P05DRAFT_539369 [Gilbertella persicaria]|uniref:uncharacterized protein n=1 Tax=Gilbertella persicaria TaxID=101096 RepID=UPI002220F690|nr:uncharacterized protein B0P05DRAFT_539369 [Gilbertella persicaria]KAI8080730.1 hypothetical protein B0P05DRAFT_539369 [Gilbertella persicaria]
MANLTNTKEDSIELARRSAVHSFIETPYHLQEHGVELPRPSKKVIEDKPLPTEKDVAIHIHHKRVLKENDNKQDTITSLQAKIAQVQKDNTNKSNQLSSIRDQIKQSKKAIHALDHTLTQVTTVQSTIYKLKEEIEEQKTMFIELSSMIADVDASWSSYQQDIEQKEQVIEELLGQLSVVKYQIMELEE